MAVLLDPKKYYRLPWSLTDNGISWLEVTSKCNLHCDGCYRDSKKDGHKTLDEIANDLAVFKKERKSDCMSVAGGDPLIHPNIVEITRMIKQEGWKPIINTNGMALTMELLRALKEAGVFGFTFHIDTSQRKRKDVNGVSSEGDLNGLRQKFAEMLSEVGDIACSFNQTVSSKTLDQVPEVVSWALKHPDIVHSVIFILYREPKLLGDFDYFANGKKIDDTVTYEITDFGGDRKLRAEDVVAKIKEVDPLYEPSAYLNGTVDPNSFKWLIATRVGNKEETFGYVTSKFMEEVQLSYHALYGKWLSYSSPKFLKYGVAGTFLAGILDSGMRKIATRYLLSLAKKPTSVVNGTYYQTFGIIQPIDVLPDGSINMCDGCPDITVHKGKLYWSCRLEEIKEYGSFATAVPKRLSHSNEKKKIKRHPEMNI